MNAKGIVAWVESILFFMRELWFKKCTYLKADKQGIRVSAGKPLMDDAIIPKWIKQKETPKHIPAKVKVTAFIIVWCPAQNMVYERVKKAIAEFEHKVIFEGINTNKKDAFLEWGIIDTLYIDNKKVGKGPSPSYKEIIKKIKSRIKNSIQAN